MLSLNYDMCENKYFVLFKLINNKIEVKILDIWIILSSETEYLKLQSEKKTRY